MADDAGATTFVVRIVRHPSSASYCRVTDVYASRSWVVVDRVDVAALRALLAHESAEPDV
ncbi:MAG: hypothetical protein M3R30_02040 [Candidatus Eremiobacteraeota bacterium]|nr:hypothetical protein [Candidatus Eremiobacteraeota bacterium]